MRKKMYWGLASLILIIGVARVYFMLQPEPEPEKKFIVPSEAALEQAREAKQPPREAKDGFTWEWHADHWHEVPIVQNDGSHITEVNKDVSDKTTENPNSDSNSLTDDAENRARINEIANIPIYSEIYKLMTENKYPYSSEVQVKITEAYKRKWAKDEEYVAKMAEIDEKVSDPNLSGKEFAKLMNEKYEAHRKYKRGN